ncbi:unnamed protein product [Prunus armeniaca]
MDPNPFPPPARGRRGRGGNYHFANIDRNKQGQIGGTAQIWKNMRNTGKKFCLGHVGRNPRLITPNQNRGKISSLLMP